VFIVAHQKGGYVPGPARPQTWLSAIAIRLVRGRRRALARNREDAALETVQGAATGEKSPAEALEIRQSLDRVQAALDTLDVDARATFILYEIENVGCDVIASLMEVPVGTVYSRLHNARKKFLQAYEDQAQLEPRLSTATGGP
jgi:RNA polymerase sigma-70 factor (ECF subfamily)